MTTIHIGSIIEAKLKEKGMSKSEFSRRMKISRTNLYNVFSRKSMDTDLLDEIGKVLDHDFFAYYSPAGAENITLKQDIEQLKYLLSILQNKDQTK